MAATRAPWMAVDSLLMVGIMAGIIAATMSGVFILRPYLHEKQWEETKGCHVKDIQLALNHEQPHGMSLSGLIDMNEGMWEEFGMSAEDMSMEDADDSRGWGRSGSSSSSSEEEGGHRGKRGMHGRGQGMMGDWSREEDCPKPVWNMMEGFGKDAMDRIAEMGIEPCIRVIALYKHKDRIWNTGLLHKDLRQQHEAEMCTVVPDLSDPEKAMEHMMKVLGPYVKALFTSESITCYAQREDDHHERWNERDDDRVPFDESSRERMREEMHERHRGGRRRPNDRRKRQAGRFGMKYDINNSVLNQRIFSGCKALASVIVPSIVAAICLVVLVIRRVCISKKAVHDQVEGKHQTGSAPGHQRSDSVCTLTVDASSKAKEAWAEKPPLPAEVGVVPSYEDAMKTAPPFYLFVTEQGEEKKIDLSKVDDATAPQKF